MPLTDQHKRVGTTFADRYDIRAVIGAGGMGTIYEAKHRFTEQTVALKIVHPRLANTEELAARFLREARAPMQVKHPGLVAVFDAGRGADGSPYLAMEKLEGETLKEAIQNKRVDYRTLVLHVVEVLEALQAAHVAGLIHRDIKPSNVFLAKDGGKIRARLLDFGVTRVMDGQKSVTAPGRTVGTPYFMAPEQALGGLVDARSDIWAAGAVLYTGLVGHPPFANDDLSIAVKELVSSAPLGVRTLNPKVPAALAEVIDRSLKLNPNHRWNSAGAMGNALRSCVGDDRVASWEATISNIELPSDQRLSVPADLMLGDEAQTQPDLPPNARKSKRKPKSKNRWPLFAFLFATASLAAVGLLVIAGLVFSGFFDAHADVPEAPPIEPTSPTPEPVGSPVNAPANGPPMQPSAPEP